MTLFDRALGFIDWMGWYILPFIVVMSAIVFFHELGHYLVGRWCGVKIEAFSLGFGPELLARVDSRGSRRRRDDHVQCTRDVRSVEFSGRSARVPIVSRGTDSHARDPRVRHKY